MAKRNLQEADWLFCVKKKKKLQLQVQVWQVYVPQWNWRTADIRLHCLKKLISLAGVCCWQMNRYYPGMNWRKN